MILGLLIDSISFPPTPMTHQYQYQYQHHPGGGRRKPCLLSLRSSLVCSLVCWFCTIGFPPMHEGMRARRTIATQHNAQCNATRHDTKEPDKPQGATNHKIASLSPESCLSPPSTSTATGSSLAHPLQLQPCCYKGSGRGRQGRGAQGLCKGPGWVPHRQYLGTEQNTTNLQQWRRQRRWCRGILLVQPRRYFPERRTLAHCFMEI
mmetsp:Transcript_2421/g.4867  ORF Transcript_2421/g.4867 Transcript_2421/m.4867 type:complete len:206 (-) Transcript_2421:40-657(-)